MPQVFPLRSGRKFQLLGVVVVTATEDGDAQWGKGSEVRREGYACTWLLGKLYLLLFFSEQEARLLGLAMK